jgi:hypothetical protein
MSKREIVEIRLGRKGDGSIARDAAFMVFADDPNRCGLYDKEPDVIAQLAPDEDIARFEAIWDGEWKFGRRVQDA